MRILLTGARGRLGGALHKLLEQRGDELLAIDIEELDITDFAATRTLVRKFQPHIVLHPAAWTDVDGCAREPERAVLVNGYGAQNVAIAAYEVNAPILYISSNEVFDGHSSRPYYEYDATNPINPYGYSKWVGEQAVMRVNPRHYIARTSWLFAHGGKNFIQAILNAAKAGKALRVVTDEVAHPTYNDDLAKAIVQLIDTGRWGIYHLVNEGSCSRYEFARYILDQAGYTETPIERITRHQWQRLSVPPIYTTLANAAARQMGITLRPWQEAVSTFLAAEPSLTQRA
jgi:dTDP-4-dehydrorhamnose reductase